MKIALLLLSAAALLAQTNDKYPRTLNGLTAAQINALTPAARMFVVQTDSLSATCSGAMTGGGSTYCIVLYNGASWVYAGGAGSGGAGITYTPVRNGTTTILDLPAITAGTMAVGTNACTSAIGTAALTRSSGDGTAWIGLASDCTVVARHNFVASCSANCTAIASSSGFDPTDLPLYQWTVTGGVFAATGTNKLIPNMSVPLVAGSNVTLSTTAGVTTISAAGGATLTPAGPYAYDGTNYLGPTWALTRPVLADFTAQNSASGVQADANSAILLTVPPTVAAANAIRLYDKAVPSAPYTVTALFSVDLDATLDYAQFGMALRLASSNDMILCSFAMPVSSTYRFIGQVTKWTDYTTYDSLYTADTDVYITSLTNIWMRWRDNNTNRYCEYSRDNKNWVTIDSSTRTDFITPDRIGFFANTNNPTAPVNYWLLSWKAE